MTRNYPEYQKDLQALITTLGNDIPQPMSGFRDLQGQSVAEGALNPKVKELIALSIAVAIRCDDCFAYQVPAALQAGASKQEVAEAIGVAILMGGAPALMVGAEAYRALEQFENAAIEAEEQA